jgi:hypothetical protein
MSFREIFLTDIPRLEIPLYYISGEFYLLNVENDDKYDFAHRSKFNQPLLSLVEDIVYFLSDFFATSRRIMGMGSSRLERWIAASPEDL